MSTDAFARASLRPIARRTAVSLVVALLAASPALAQFSPRFETLAPLSVSIGPDQGKHSFVLADVNDDRRLDVITIEPDDDRVAVYINMGNGTFDLMGNTPGAGGITPTAVTVGDVGSPFASNEAGKPDGNPDIIVGGDSGEVAILFGHNNGQFDSPSEEDVLDDLDPTVNILGVVVGDFDEGNGRDVALLDDDGVVLLCNDGNGQLATCTGDEALDVGGDFPIKIAQGDFDGDGNLDVVVLNPEEQNVGILLGNGDGTFDAVVNVDVKVEATLQDDSATDLDVARMDSDNLDDIVVVNDSTFNLNLGAIVFGAGNGRFRVNDPFVVDFGATSITLADFDAASDRATDAITGFGGDESSGVQASTGIGTGELGDPFTPIGASSIGDVAALASGDLGGDTLPDFIALNDGGDQMRVAINKSNEATPTAGPTTPVTPSTPTPTVTGPPPPTATMTGTSTPTASATPTSTPTPIPTADYGRCDGEVGTSLTAIAAGDLDGDGLPDLAASDAGAGVVRLVFNTVLADVKACARAMQERPIASTSVNLPEGRTPGPIAIADLDDDGVNEIAVGTDGGVLILKRTDGIFAAVPDPTPVGGTVRAITAGYPDHPNDPRSRGLLDLDGDRVGDLVIANGTTTLTIVYGVDAQLPGRSVTQPTSCGATAVDAGDFNGDGLIDIAVGCGSRASWLQQLAGTGDTPTFQPKNDFATGSPIVGVMAGYLDGDGLVDLLVTRGTTTGVGETYLSRNGTFVLAPSGSFSAGSGPVAGGLGRLNRSHNRFDAVIAAQSAPTPETTATPTTRGSVLQFAYNDGKGGFPGPVVMPFMLHDSPRALVVVDFDSDGQQDVALANADGTLSILVSSEPPPTPTPTVTFTATATGTATITQTPSITPTDTPTGTPEPTTTPTDQSTATRTVTPGPSPTPTNTRGGIVLSSCAIADTGPSAPAQVLLIAALLAAARLLAVRRAVAAKVRHARD